MQRITVILWMLLCGTVTQAQKLMGNEKLYLLDISKDYRYLVTVGDYGVSRWNLSDGSLDKEYSWATIRGTGLSFMWSHLASMSPDAGKVVVVCGINEGEQATIDLNTGKVLDLTSRMVANHAGFTADGTPIGIEWLMNGWDARPKTLHTVMKEGGKFVSPRIDEGDVRVFSLSGDRELFWYSPVNRIKDYYLIEDIYVADFQKMKRRKISLPKKTVIPSQATNFYIPGLYHKDYIKVQTWEKHKGSRENGLYNIAKDKVVVQGEIMQVSDEGNIGIRKGPERSQRSSDTYIQLVDLATGNSIGDTITLSTTGLTYLRLNETNKELYVNNAKKGALEIYNYTNWTLKRSLPYRMTEQEFLLAMEQKKAEDEAKSKALMAAAPASFKQYIVNFDPLPANYQFSIENASGRDVTGSPHASRGGGSENAMGVIGDCGEKLFLLSLLKQDNGSAISYAPVVKTFRKDGTLLGTVTLGQTIEQKGVGRTHEVSFTMSKSMAIIQFQVVRKVGGNTYRESKVINMNTCNWQ